MSENGEKLRKEIGRVKKRGERVRQQRVLEEGSSVQQHPRDRVNINSIVARYVATKDENLLRGSNDPIYATVDMGLELQEAMDTIQVAQERFMELDASIRAAAENSLPQFLDMLNDPQQVELLQELGLRLEGEPDPDSVPFSSLKAGAPTEESGTAAGADKSTDGEPEPSA